MSKKILEIYTELEIALFLFKLKREDEIMQKYTLKQIVKTLEKLFKSNYTTTNQIKTIKWDELEKINKDFTPYN